MYRITQVAAYTKQLRKLQKSYRRVGDDLTLFLDRLEAGDFAADAPMQGFQQKIFKARIASSDQKKGKSGGFRIVYYLLTDAEEIVLLSIYTKARQENISAKEIQLLLKELS